MKDMEVRLDEEGFEEVQATEKPADKGGADSGSAGPNRPDFRVVQTDRDKDGKVVYKNVGGIWKNTSKTGKEYLVLNIGQLRLLVFPNDRK